MVEDYLGLFQNLDAEDDNSRGKHGTQYYGISARLSWCHKSYCFQNFVNYIHHLAIEARLFKDYIRRLFPYVTYFTTP